MASYQNLKNGTILRDQQHADHLFNVDQFRLAPKHKFLFHVAFGLNKSIPGAANLAQAHGSEIGMLVKAVDLPNYKVETQVLNQYNRKKVVQYKHKPGAIGIKFVDDNMGVINQLWQAYYKYYYADPTSANTFGAYARNATKTYSVAMPVKYGLDNASTNPFFNYIKIYQMARHEYIMYELWNPIIESFNHNRVDYYQQGVHDFDMRVDYEAVSYSSGKVANGEPEGFAQGHYDLNPSPLSGGGSVSNYPSLTTASAAAAIGVGILSNAINTANNYQGANGLTTGGISGSVPLLGAGLGLLAGGAGLLSGAVKGAIGLAESAVSGLKGFAFPGAASTDSKNTEAGTTGTDSANEGANPTAEQKNTTEASDQTQETQTNVPENSPQGDQSTPENTEASTGTPENPSSNPDSSSSINYDDF
jgi:hypothetical protein